MIKTDKIRKPQPVLLYIIDYLWSGFTGLSVAMMVVALWAWGSAVFGEFMLPAPADVFQKALELLEHFQQNEIGISLWRSVVGITIALVAGLAAGLIAGSFKTAMALLKPVITILLAMPPIIWVVMALFWFGFGNPSVLFTIIVLVAPLTFASAAMGMASVNKQHEELFNAFLEAFVKFASNSVYFSGKENILYQPEFNDVDKLRRLVSAFENSKVWKTLPLSSEDGIQINIGNETPLGKMNDVSVISASFKTGETSKGSISVIGPTRMPYEKVVALVEYISENIEKACLEDKQDEK